MKKLLACLLALMLPFGALADCIRVQAHTYLSPSGIMELLTQLDDDLTPGTSYPKLKKWAEKLNLFVRGFYLSTTIDIDNARAKLALYNSGEALFSYNVAMGDQGAVALHSWMPDTPLLLSEDSLLANPPAALRSVDWDAAGHTFDAVLRRWTSALESTEEAGRFAGDAYTGGSYRTTVRFDDRDLALLLDMLLDGPWPESFTSLLSQPIRLWGAAPGEVLAMLRGIIRQAGLENRYRYVLHLVDDDQGATIGLSAIAYLEDEQVATLSVGQDADNDTMTYVLGWGLRGENDYLVIKTFDPQNKLGDCILSAVLICDPTRTQNLSAISTDPSNTVMYANLFDESQDDSSRWRLSMSGEALANQKIDLVLDLSWYGDFRFFHAMSVQLNDYSIIWTSLRTIDEEDGLEPLDVAGLEPLDVGRISQEERDALVEQIRSGLMELSVQVFKLMPPELLTLPMDPDFLSPE